MVSATEKKNNKATARLCLLNFDEGRLDCAGFSGKS